MNEINDTTSAFFNNKYQFNTVPIWKASILYTLVPVLIMWRVYRWWEKVAVDYNYKVSPFWRSAFMLITNFSLFKIIEKHANYHGIKFFMDSKWLASMCFITLVIPATQGIGNVFLDLISSMIFAFPYIYIQYKINEVNQKVYPDALVEKWDIWDTIFATEGLLYKILDIFSDRRN